jgi:hypothetical protein
MSWILDPRNSMTPPWSSVFSPETPGHYRSGLKPISWGCVCLGGVKAEDVVLVTAKASGSWAVRCEPDEVLAR